MNWLQNFTGMLGRFSCPMKNHNIQSSIASVISLPKQKLANCLKKAATPTAWEMNTHFRFVKNANSVDNTQEMAFAIMMFQPQYSVKRA